MRATPPAVKKLIIVTGPTASGKTATAVKLAQRLNTEVISADSRQFYREMSIGTAAPTLEEMNHVPHHFIGNLSVIDPYDVFRYLTEVKKLLGHLFLKQDVVVMAGGSGLYIDAVCRGISSLPDADPGLRNSLNQELNETGIDSMRNRLKFLDPVYYSSVDLANPKRLIRAMEVCIQTGKPYSSFLQTKTLVPDFQILMTGLNMPREELRNRISIRTEQMISGGLIEEVRSLLPFRHLNSLNTVGYKEIFLFLDGKYSLDEAIEKIKTNTWRYAKKQLTWFARYPEIQWFHPENFSDFSHFITAWVKEN